MVLLIQKFLFPCLKNITENEFLSQEHCPEAISAGIYRIFLRLADTIKFFQEALCIRPNSLHHSLEPWLHFFSGILNCNLLAETNV